MTDKAKLFERESQRVAFDLKHRKTIRFNMSKYDAAVSKGNEKYSNIELAKQRASYIKEKVIRNWDKYLIEFEENLKKRGVKVFWARDEKEIIEQLIPILKKKETKMLVKSKSMTTEEIELNQHLEKAGIESVETDLGEFIVQVAGEKPYHIVTPAMHKSKEDVAELFNKHFDTPINSSPTEMTNFVRGVLREKFVKADVGVTGANFLIADTGAIALTENEGNGLMSVSFPKTHIVIAGIEKIIPSINDLDTLWPLLATHGTGQKMTVYNTIFNSGRNSGETDGPEEMYVFLIDNGRTHLFEQEEQHEALKCIRCGACLNACPVYKNIGGYTYNTTYSGPIGSIITPHFNGMEEFKHLSFASSLCGKCTEVCPVKIDIHKLLLYNRRDSVEAGHSPKMEKLAMQGYKFAMKHRKLQNLGNAKLKNKFAQTFASSAWGEKRQFPELKDTFNKQWRKKNN
ncbi:MAG: LutB/LldF family L-lactate oxidation iron-sulfur protein [Bacteroidota bacterium]|nr:LutB/LldF family L-lactate oxidation iron-sulfur protein [Bacteroidota bacterium]